MAEKDEGYTKHYRKIRHHWLRERAREQGFDDEHAWLDLIDMANYKTEKFSYRGKIVQAERGTVYRSKAFLAKEWGWNDARVRRFLELLESDEMIEVKITGHLTAIKLLNYAVYQDSNTDDSKGSQQVNDEPLSDSCRKNVGNLTGDKAVNHAVSGDSVTDFCRKNVGSLSDSCRIDVGSVSDSCRIDVGSVSDSCRIRVGSVSTYNKDNKDKEREEGKERKERKERKETRAREDSFFSDENSDLIEEEEISDEEWERQMREYDEELLLRKQQEGK